MVQLDIFKETSLTNIINLCKSKKSEQKRLRKCLRIKEILDEKTFKYLIKQHKN